MFCMPILLFSYISYSVILSSFLETLSVYFSLMRTEDRHCYVFFICSSFQMEPSLINETMCLYNHICCILRVSGEVCGKCSKSMFIFAKKYVSITCNFLKKNIQRPIFAPIYCSTLFSIQLELFLYRKFIY